MDTLVVGDRFIPASSFVTALAQRCGPAFGPVRTVDLPGSRADQHELQQAMEVRGPAAVPVPDAVLAAAGGARVLCVHFAPVGAALFAAAPALRLVAVARTGLENVDLAAASERGVGWCPCTGATPARSPSCNWP